MARDVIVGQPVINVTDAAQAVRRVHDLTSGTTSPVVMVYTADLRLLLAMSALFLEQR